MPGRGIVWRNAGIDEKLAFCRAPDTVEGGLFTPLPVLYRKSQACS